MARNSRAPARPRRERSRVAPAKRDEARDVRTAILEGIERLLAQQQLEAITVFDVIAEAGISRATFYLYFESKNAAVATLAEEVTATIYADVWQPFITGVEPPSEALLTQHFEATIAIWREHRAVLMAAAGAWRADPDSFYRWGAMWSRYVEDASAYIERARESGLAPPGVEARALAATLIWLDEAALYLALTDGSPDLRDDELLAPTLAGVWMRAIYGSVPFK
jgi:AcrR family transcriptional regulator